MAIVKFVAIGSEKNIEDQCKYADNILTELERQGYIDKYIKGIRRRRRRGCEYVKNSIEG